MEVGSIPTHGFFPLHSSPASLATLSYVRRAPKHLNKVGLSAQGGLPIFHLKAESAYTFHPENKGGRQHPFQQGLKDA